MFLGKEGGEEGGREKGRIMFAFFFLNSPVFFPSFYNNIASMIRKKKIFLKK